MPGFLLGLGLIMAIGAQNALVLRQGLRGEHVFVICLACALSDALLILTGVLAFAWISAVLPWLEPAMRWGGAAFLIFYGLRGFLSAFGRDEVLLPAGGPAPPLMPALAATMAITWLNPHVYLDTVVLVGSVSAQYGTGRAMFAAGAMLASFVFFFSLGYGARLLRPLFARPFAWRVLEAVTGCVMWAIAADLLIG